MGLRRQYPGDSGDETLESQETRVSDSVLGSGQETLEILSSSLKTGEDMRLRILGKHDLELSGDETMESQQDPRDENLDSGDETLNRILWRLWILD